MKNYKLFTIVILLFNITLLSAQNIQGKAYYISKTDTQLDFSSRQGMPEEVKSRIQEQVNKMSSKTYILNFNATNSIYQEETVLDETALSQNQFGNNMRMMFSAQDIGILYKDINKKEYTNQRDLYGKLFLIKDNLPSNNWSIESETKQIGNYICYKATAIIKMPKRGLGMPNSRPQKNDDDEKTTLNQLEDVEVIVWYTLDIPIQQGPDKFWGLPGLILEVEMGNTKILCTKVELKKSKEIVEITPPKKGKKLNQEEYDEILEKKIKEIRGSFGRPGGMSRRGN